MCPPGARHPPSVPTPIPDPRPPDVIPRGTKAQPTRLGSFPARRTSTSKRGVPRPPAPTPRERSWFSSVPKIISSPPLYHPPLLRPHLRISTAAPGRRIVPSASGRPDGGGEGTKGVGKIWGGLGANPCSRTVYFSRPGGPANCRWLHPGPPPAVQPARPFRCGLFSSLRPFLLPPAVAPERPLTGHGSRAFALYSGPSYPVSALNSALPSRPVAERREPSRTLQSKHRRSPLLLRARYRPRRRASLS